MWWAIGIIGILLVFVLSDYVNKKLEIELAKVKCSNCWVK